MKEEYPLSKKLENVENAQKQGVASHLTVLIIDMWTSGLSELFTSMFSCILENVASLSDRAGPGGRPPGFNTARPRTPPWATHVTPLGCSFSLCEIGVSLAPPPVVEREHDTVP